MENVFERYWYLNKIHWNWENKWVKWMKMSEWIEEKIEKKKNTSDIWFCSILVYAVLFWENRENKL